MTRKLNNNDNKKYNKVKYYKVGAQDMNYEKI